MELSPCIFKLVQISKRDSKGLKAGRDEYELAEPWERFQVVKSLSKLRESDERLLRKSYSANFKSYNRVRKACIKGKTYSYSRQFVK